MAIINLHKIQILFIVCVLCVRRVYCDVMNPEESLTYFLNVEYMEGVRLAIQLS